MATVPAIIARSLIVARTGHSQTVIGVVINPEGDCAANFSCGLGSLSEKPLRSSGSSRQILRRADNR